MKYATEARVEALNTIQTLLNNVDACTACGTAGCKQCGQMGYVTIGLGQPIDMETRRQIIQEKIRMRSNRGGDYADQ
ncbi:hypothetical protein [Thalassospira xiamenensis]|uniref:hypothetical protein n=1 Tax=Thalassospira xiamenensis TaxID=220697 RepID=UPI003AA86FD5